MGLFYHSTTVHSFSYDSSVNEASFTQRGIRLLVSLLLRRRKAEHVHRLILVQTEVVVWISDFVRHHDQQFIAEPLNAFDTTINSVALVVTGEIVPFTIIVVYFTKRHAHMRMQVQSVQCTLNWKAKLNHVYSRQPCTVIYKVILLYFLAKIFEFLND